MKRVLKKLGRTNNIFIGRGEKFPLQEWEKNYDEDRIFSWVGPEFFPEFFHEWVQNLFAHFDEERTRVSILEYRKGMNNF